MSTRMTFRLNGVTASTTVPDDEAARTLESLQRVWVAGNNGHITVGGTDGSPALHLQMAAIQCVETEEAR